MSAARVLAHARKGAGVSQRAVARRAGLAQSEVARIETGAVVPRVDTLERLLAALGQELGTRPRLGVGIDRTAMRELLDRSPGERARIAAVEANNLFRVRRRPNQ